MWQHMELSVKLVVWDPVKVTGGVILEGRGVPLFSSCFLCFLWYVQRHQVCIFSLVSEHTNDDISCNVYNIYNIMKWITAGIACLQGREWIIVLFSLFIVSLINTSSLLSQVKKGLHIKHGLHFSSWLNDSWQFIILRISVYIKYILIWHESLYITFLKKTLWPFIHTATALFFPHWKLIFLKMLT